MILKGFMVNSMHKKLTRDEQIDLFHQMRCGNTSARDDLIDSCLPLVINIAKKFRFNNKHIDLEDLIQEGSIALMKAVDNWDINKSSITTVATWYVRNALIDMITDARYNIKYPYDMSRRASEQLRKIKNLDSNNIDYIAQETGLSKKRVKKLLSVSPRGSSRLSIEEKAIQKRTNYEGEYAKPCMGDLIELINNNLNGEQKNIFCQWAGINRKKIGKKQIAESLGKTEQYVYDNIKSATRVLSNAVKVIQNA